MANTIALQAYRDTRIKTASGGQLIIMLYDGAVKKMDNALELLRLNSGSKKNPSRIEEIGKSILKTQEIITELMVSLDFEQGGEIAKNLFALYTWFNKEILEAHVSHDIAKLKMVRDMIDDLRKTWVETVARTQALEKRSPVPAAGLNIAG
ncbi:MAG: flagellar export chaperone FliS [Termitinemataceae bacterium]|nr:MAG: flagellar export chaperone FliS [Termitinemataceae bacterium]